MQSWGLSEGRGCTWDFLHKGGYKRKGFRTCTGEISAQPTKRKRLGGLGAPGRGVSACLSLGAPELAMHRATNPDLPQLQPQMLHAFHISITAFLQDASHGVLFLKIKSHGRSGSELSEYKFRKKRHRVAMAGLWLGETSKTPAPCHPDVERRPSQAPTLRGAV